MANYDLSEPLDIDIMRNDYDNISAEEWQEYIDFSNLPENKKVISFEARGCLMRMQRKAGTRYRPADKDIRWGLGLAEKIENLMLQQEQSEEGEAMLKNENNLIKSKHVTFRVAWHDNKWNGSICNDPAKNKYCSGFHSLLSERLRKRKAENFDKEIKFKGQPVTEEYLPPCFWSINVFGNQPLKVNHDNPAEKKLNHIEEVLPPFSMFSWAFGISFSRTKDQQNIDGSYPRNLEDFRIPFFQSKIKNSESVAFMYTKYSNPFTEEDYQYLVVGCALVTDKGEPSYFTPQSIIDNKRKSRASMRNFPSMNWALRYSFENPDLRIRMPYHEYLDYFNQSDIDEEVKHKNLDKIKVAISEPELEHCFKYVAMDVDDDEAIYILSKMRFQLMQCQNDGIVPVEEMKKKIDGVEKLLNYCWKKRTHFPGFGNISREILNWDKPEFPLDNLIDELIENELDDYVEKLTELLEDPMSDKKYKRYQDLLFDLTETFVDNLGLDNGQFLQLCMLNLKTFQYKRILKGKLKLSGDWKKTIDDEKRSHTIEEICDNPYLLYEDYEAYHARLNPVSGEEEDAPIELFKIDTAYFPDRRFGMKRIPLQRKMRNNDKRRLRAVVFRFLKTLENTGHCFADAEEIESAISNYPLFYNIDEEYNIPSRFFQNLKDDYIIHFEKHEEKIKVVSENDTKYFYLFKVYKAEAGIEKVVHSLLKETNLNDEYQDLESYLNNSCTEIGKKLGNHFDELFFREERKRLYQNIYKKRFFVLAGNPGGGKSYELLNVIQDLERKGQSYLLLTPTGKAALRLKSDSKFQGIEAYTIDKIITDIKNGKLNKATLQRVNSIIIDEMSMVDLLKFKRVLDLFNFNLPSFKRLILVGDPHQLPAIGYGKVLKDVLYFLSTHPDYVDNFIELQSNYRNELAESKLLELSEGFVTEGSLSTDLKKLLSSNQIEVSKGLNIHYWNDEDMLYQKMDNEFANLSERLKINGSQAEKLHQFFKLNRNGKLSNEQGLDVDRFQIITPYKADFFGASQINQHIQTNYKSDSKIELMDNWFKQSDKIIRTKNYYDKKGKLMLSNGSVGIIRKEGKTEKFHFAELDESIEVYDIRKNEREFFDLAYAITVHKSQGSGFNHMFFILPKKSSLLSKELVYTALTRCRESITLFIQGAPEENFEKSVLGKAINRSYTESRKTTLLLDRPFRYYSLEVDGNYIASRVELLIYQALKAAKEKYGEPVIDFEYEIPPVVEGKELPMKTDFTIITPQGNWYWEHLGRLGNRNYEWTWHNVKRKSYQKFGAEERLITTHEKNGINPDKISSIIEMIVKENLKTEDPQNRYSLFHFSLR